MKKTKLPNIVSVLILTLITSVMWISFNVYRAFTTKPAPVVPAEISEPLTPTLDTDAINQIESRTFLGEGEIPQTVVTPEASATPSPTAVPSPTPTLEASPTASAAATPTAAP